MPLLLRRDCKLGVGVFFSLQDVLHGIVYDGKGVDLHEQILTILVGMHNQGEPQIIVVDPLMISLLKYHPSGFVKGHVGDQHSWKAETTFVSFPYLKHVGLWCSLCICWDITMSNTSSVIASSKVG